MRILAATFAITSAVGVLTGYGKSEPATTADGRTVVRYQGQTGQVTPFELAADLGYFNKISPHWEGDTTSDELLERLYAELSDPAYTARFR
ncbi:hypothetical protein [Nocardia sp. NBC_01503]|uniref:hypothetical protein n=1 Tax=Nocardia sp. NBC_01503 TaxID=2975997 RepID=UPI003FA5B9D6